MVAPQATRSQPSTSGGAGALPDSQSAREKFEQMLQAPSQPAPDASFRELYSYAEYNRNVSRKMKKMRRLLKTESFASALEADAYWAELSRIRDTYPEDGHRDHLYELVGNLYLLSLSLMIFIWFLFFTGGGLPAFRGRFLD